MKKIIFILFTLFSVQLSAQIEQPRIKFNQVIKDSTGVGHIVISSLDDSSMVYSADFYINPVDSTLVLFGTALGAGQLSSVDVDSIYLFGDGAANPIYLDKQRLLDSLSPFLSPNIAPGLGIDTAIVDNTVVIQSLRVEEYVKNVTTDSLYKGYPVYQVDSTIGGNAIGVALADASDPTKMPAVGILKQDLAPGEEGVMIFSGLIQGVNTLGFTSGDVVYVAVGGGYTNVPPKSEGNLIQNLGRVIKVHETNGSGIIMGAGRANAVPNLNPGNIFYGGLDSSAITINLPALLSDSLSAYTSLTVLADSLSAYSTSAAFQQQFTAGGTSYTVTTADLPVDINNVLVFQNGQVLDKTMFTKSGNTITLNFQPEVGDRIIVMWFKGDIVDIGGNYVTLDQTETITGAKTFTKAFTQSGGDANFDSGTLFVDESANSVGIGTSSPSNKLTISGSTGNFIPSLLIDADTDYGSLVEFRSNPSIGSIQFNLNRNTGNQNAGIGAFAITGFGHTAFKSITTGKNIYFQVDDNQTKMTILNNGNVGIGTSNPGVPLEVNGNARVNGLSIGTYNASNTPVDLKFNSSSAQIFRFFNEGTGGAKMRFVSDNTSEASHQWTVSSAWLAQIAAKYNSTNENNNYMDFRVRGASDANTEAGLEAATKMRILGNGNVGIGTSLPTAPLEIATYGDKPSLRIGALNFQSFSINNAFLTDNLYYAPGGFRYTGNGKGSIFYFIDGGFVVRTSPNNTSGSDAIANTYDKFNMTNAGGFSFGSYANLYKGADTIIMPGPVGIGTSSPSASMELVVNPVGNNDVTKSLKITNTSTTGNAVGLFLNGQTKNANLGLGINDTLKALINYDTKGFVGFLNFAYSNKDFALRLKDDGSLLYVDPEASNATRFIVQANGNVGIGTSTPSATFDMQNGSGALFEVEYTTASPYLGQGVKFIDSDDNTSFIQVFSASGTDNVFLPYILMKRGSGQTQAGGVGGYFAVDVSSGLDFTDANAAAYTITTVEDGTYNDPLENMNTFMVRNGITPQFKIEADGEVFFSQYGAITDLRLDSNGKLYDGGSDERLKNSIENISYGLKEIMLLQPKQFWRNEDAQNYDLKEIGFIAQEVRTSIPNAVVNSKNGYLQLRTNAILATTVKAIQEQQAIIETQEQKITDLETENQNLNTLIQNLITRIEALENK